MKNGVASICILSCLLAACGYGATDESPIFSNLGEGAFGGACEFAGIATGDTVAVSDGIVLRDKPNGKQLINERASEVLKEIYPQQVDNTEVLRELCRTKEWSKIQVIEPASLSHVTGWLPVSKLRSIEQTGEGKRKYVAEDFFWDEDTEQHKKPLVAAVNRIATENANCASVDPGTLASSPSRSAPGKPVFFITCNSPDDRPFNVWFELGDATSGKSFAAVQNIERGTAVLACEQAAKSAANNPQTVDFSRFMDVAFLTYPDGNSRLLSSFTAKNAFGVEGKFTIGCFFEGSTLSETSINEALN